MRYFTLFFIAIVAHAQDCMPNTFCALSNIINKPVAYKTWTDDLLPNGSQKTPTLQKGLAAWRVEMPSVELELNYSAYKALDKNNKEPSKPIQFGVPYVWIGFPAKENSSNTEEAHAALVYFFANNVVVITTYNVTRIENKDAFTFYIESLSYQDFLVRTIYVFELTSKDPLTIKPFTELLIVK